MSEGYAMIKIIYTPWSLFRYKLIEPDPGETVILHCLANADPLINHYMWKHDDQQLTVSIRNYMLFNITEDSNGTSMCIPVSDVGNGS